MALEIIRPQHASPAGLVADRRLYEDGARAKAVEEGDPAAAFLLATPGRVIPADICARYGLSVVDGRVVVAVAASSEVSVGETAPAAESPPSAPVASSPAAPTPKPKKSAKSGG